MSDGTSNCLSASVVNVVHERKNAAHENRVEDYGSPATATAVPLWCQTQSAVLVAPQTVPFLGVGNSAQKTRDHAHQHEHQLNVSFNAIHGANLQKPKRTDIVFRNKYMYFYFCVNRLNQGGVGAGFF